MATREGFNRNAPVSPNVRRSALSSTLTVRVVRHRAVVVDAGLLEGRAFGTGELPAGHVIFPGRGPGVGLGDSQFTAGPRCLSSGKCHIGSPFSVTVHQSVGGPRSSAGVGITA